MSVARIPDQTPPSFCLAAARQLKHGAGERSPSIGLTAACRVEPMIAASDPAAYNRNLRPRSEPFHHDNPNARPTQKAEKSRPAAEDLRHLRAPVHVAQEVGESLGRGSLLLGPLPPKPKTLVGLLFVRRERFQKTSRANLHIVARRFTHFIPGRIDLPKAGIFTELRPVAIKKIPI